MTIDSLLKLMASQGNSDYIGEPVSQLQHALLAARSAEVAGAGETMILAALLHDIGHLETIANPISPGQAMADLGRFEHELIGAEMIRSAGLRAEIADLIAMHVNAKRYLSCVNGSYGENLSKASRKTLVYQGGPMLEPEAHQFAQHPLFKEVLQVRAWDEAAKLEDPSLPEIHKYQAMLRRNLACPLTDVQIQSWRNSGFLHLPGWFSKPEMSKIEAATQNLQDRPEAVGKWMKYFETPNTGSRMLCRIENFLDYDACFSEVVRGDAILNLMACLMGTEAALFKEKINFKLPGGQGFSPHQDAPAFTSFDQHYHVTMMLSVDGSNTKNGCLEVAHGQKLNHLLAMNEDLTIAEHEVQKLMWRKIETAPGDIVLFDSYLPHRSGVNHSQHSRRALYATYNRLSEGQVRDLYFQEKRAAFPPDNEKVAGRQYENSIFNVGNPIEANNSKV